MFSSLKIGLVLVMLAGAGGGYLYVNKLQKDTKYIDKILKEGGNKANLIASKKVEEMKEIIGF